MVSATFYWPLSKYGDWTCDRPERLAEVLPPFALSEMKITTNRLPRARRRTDSPENVGHS